MAYLRLARVIQTLKNIILIENMIKCEVQRNKNPNMDYYGNAFILEFLEI